MEYFFCPIAKLRPGLKVESFVVQEGDEGESILVMPEGAKDETILNKRALKVNQLWSCQKALKIKKMS